MELPGVVVERTRPPAVPPVSGDPFRGTAPAPVPDTVHVLRPWSWSSSPGSPWWLLGSLLTGWPAFVVWRNGEPLFWVGVLLVAPIWFLLPAIRSVHVRSSARLELTGHDVRIQPAPRRPWQRIAIRGARLAVRPSSCREGFLLVAVSPAGDAVELMHLEQRATAEALVYLLGKELGLVEPVDTHRRDEATRTRAPLGPLGPLVDALAPDRD